MVRNTVNMKGFIRDFLQEGDAVPVMSWNQSLPLASFVAFTLEGVREEEWALTGETED